MCSMRKCDERLLFWLIGLFIKIMIAVLEVGNWFAGPALSDCKTRPDLFWRSFNMFHMLVCWLVVTFLMDFDRMSHLLPSTEFNMRIGDLLGKSLFALEIAGFLVFFAMVISAYSTCSVKGIWVGLYYWVLAVLAFLFGCFLLLLWLVAGQHIFRANYQYQTIAALRPLYRAVKYAGNELDQRHLYRQFRHAVDNSYNVDAFYDLDFQLIEKHTAHLINSNALERELEQFDRNCVFCTERLKVGEKIVVFKECLHFGHIGCLISRLKSADLCMCGVGMRQAVTEPCFPGNSRPDLTELICIRPPVVQTEAIIVYRSADPYGEDVTDDYLEFVNFWDIKEEGVDQDPDTVVDVEEVEEYPVLEG